ncbi:MULTISPECIES: M20/M25/M40 family metallo-hydrolase [Clostridium]|uniref:M20/M25/M40 family metallo-hydrolase n=1 Tax=Clostridium cibarium TaxID=2762247 RepID=A0ABR8PXM8_9CLOT|nr:MULTISPECIES: M20/M25/M40 family metallo-hydrolase [Clostridium]MBD7912892.1 M20/M25/M40 family metallo-hydrolase [Clostridium cibarium]
MNSDDIVSKSYSEVINLTKQLIPSHPMYANHGQFEGQKILQDYLNSKGWTTYLDEYGFEDLKKNEIMKKPWEYDDYYKGYEKIKKYNLYGILDSGIPGKTLILNGHIDVDIIDKDNPLENCEPYLSSDRLWGRGSTDMLSGLCSLATIKNYLDNISWSGKVIYTAVVDEEIGGNGSIRACQWMREKGFLESEYPIECIISEPSDCNICYETLGFLPFIISCKSQIKHMNGEGNKMNFFKLTNIFNELAKLQISDDELNVNVGYIHGGNDASLPMEDLLLKGVIATTAEHNNDYVEKVLSDCGADIFIPGISINAVKSSNNIFGKSLYKGDLFKSSCDASVFYNHNIPVCVFGPGSLEQAHTRKEYILLSEIERYLTQFYKCVREYFD